jgi:hypothetical protein
MDKKKEIKLLKNNSKREWEDLQWVQEFYKFLQGNAPNGIQIATGHKPKLSQKKAYTIIWYLQEHFSILPDHIEQCSVCGELYDSNTQGHHSELTGKFYCSIYCEPSDLEERELRAEKQLKINSNG